jgi:membrane protein implicated in regulation of membrane protease activity
MCHLILLMPIIGLVVFWIWPLSVALPVYLVILTTSAMVYAAIMRSMHRRVKTGAEGMIGEPVEVIDMTGRGGHVRVDGEIWQAKSNEPFREGDEAVVLAVNGLTLTIGRRTLPERRNTAG